LKRTTRILAPVLLAAFLALVLAFVPAPRVHAQAPQPGSPAAQAAKTVAKGEHMDAPESDNSIEQYRHSAAVHAIARFTGLSTETVAQIFEDFNSAVLILAVAWLLWKFVPRMLRNRSETLQKDLLGARQATEDANRRLAGVEARLLRLDSEIDAIRKQVEHEAIHDEKRIHDSLESEKERIVASAEQEIAAAQSAAQRELKKFAADLAIDNAMRRIQLTAETDRTLIRDFGKRLGDNKNSGGEA
jgi:F-type H+-transporting ATPase subunit b